MRLTDRGVLKAGMWADVVIFNPMTVHDRATFDNPNQLSEGMEYVLVNGGLVIDQGKMTGALPGRAPDSCPAMLFTCTHMFRHVRCCTKNPARWPFS